MIEIIDALLLLLYVLTVSCALYVLLAHRRYFVDRFRKGVVSAFMLAMLFFLSAYTVKMVVAVWIRSSQVFEYRTPLIETLQLFAWLLAHLGTTTGLVILAVLTYRKRFDLYFYLRKIDKFEKRTDDK
jgi:uncharacterized membrane protein YqaE (UPF0057 family)